MQTDTVTPRDNEVRSYATAGNDERPPAGDLLLDYVTEYAQQRPEIVALWAFGIGFCLGWKLKPW